jgi:hypothetical protein
MTPDEAMAIDGLLGVTFQVASWDKRFHRDVLTEARRIGIIGEKSAPQLWRIFTRYRRQVRTPEPDRSRLLKLAAAMAAPDYRKQQAAAAAQRRIDDLKLKHNSPDSNSPD